MGVCVAGPRLTPEQRVFVRCAVSTSGEPWSMALCVGGQDTVNELTKCINVGFGSNGCFGPGNTVVQFVQNAWKDVTVGPGPGNEMVKAREALLRGDRGSIAQFIRNPLHCAQFWRKKC